MLDDIGESFLSHAVELVKSGHKFVFVLDNIDWEEKVHDMRKESQNKSVHAMATTIVFSRVSLPQPLPNNHPQEDLRKCNVHQVVNLSSAEIDTIRKRYRIIIQNILLQQFPAFESFKPSSPLTTYCQCAESMSEKSETVTMPVLLKDEKKYAECVDVLDQLEQWTYDIYSAAGLCQTRTDPDPPMSPPVMSTCSSRPDQPGSHIPPSPSDDDPLRGIKIPCFGDQLTRVRFAGAKDLRAGCHTAKQRLDHLYPFCIADWHTKRSFLKVIIPAINIIYENAVGGKKIISVTTRTKNFTLLLTFFNHRPSSIPL